MVSAREADQQKLVTKMSVQIKDHVQMPEWAKFVKTGMSRERAPQRDDWWHVRTASMLRTIYLHGPIGVNKLRVKYGGKHRRGYAPPRFELGGGNILRKVMQQLEQAGLVKQVQKDTHKGRVVTPAGRSFLDKIASQMAQQK